MRNSITQIQLSRRAELIAPFMAMEIMERASQLEAEGRKVIHLEVGEPDFSTPEPARIAGIEAIHRGQTHYTHSLGRWELREEIAAFYSRKYSLRIDPERVVVTVGSSGAMVLAFAALIDPGIEVLLTDPHYACYPKFILTFGGVPAPIPVFEEDKFALDPAVVTARIGAQTRALIVNSPANPTGVVMSRDQLSDLVRAVDERLVILSDEIYHGLTYGCDAHSILEFTDRAVVLNGFSKLFAMTGWRLGYLILPPELVRPIQKLQQNLFISPPDFAQAAALQALRAGGEAVEDMRRHYAARRAVMLQRLREMGFELTVEPAGAFYVFLNVRKFTDNVMHFALELLQESGVAVTPGSDFGAQGEGYIRLSYATSLENIEEGMDRLALYLGRRRSGSGS